MGTARKPRRPITMIEWLIGETTYHCDVLGTRCPKCGEMAVVELPPPERAKQTDGTTHVCLHLIGGCNHGFEVTS
jgi:hypothetical protein